MAHILASGGAGANGVKFLWNLDFDDVANTVQIATTYLTFEGDPAPAPPQVASITVTLNTSVNVTVNCLTGTISTGGNFSQASPGQMLNTTKTRTGVTLRVSAGRAAALSFSTAFTPPA